MEWLQILHKLGELTYSDFDFQAQKEDANTRVRIQFVLPSSELPKLLNTATKAVELESLPQVGTLPSKTSELVHPGILLTRLISERGIEINDLARKADIALDILGRILQGKATLPAITAIILEYEFPELGYPAEFWMRLMADWTVAERRKEFLKERQSSNSRRSS